MDKGGHLGIFRLHIVVIDPEAVGNLGAATTIGQTFNHRPLADIGAQAAAVRPDAISAFTLFCWQSG